MKRSELKTLIKEVVTEYLKTQHLNEGVEGDTTMGVNGIGTAELFVEYSAEVYQGSGSPDDPNAVDLIYLRTTQPLTLDDISTPTASEQKVIQSLRAASKKQIPNFPDNVIVPAKIDVYKLDHDLNGWLSEDIDNLKASIYKKSPRYRR